MKIFVLCEKPSQTEALSELLDNSVRRGRAVTGRYKEHELILFPLRGHILEIPLPEKLDSRFKGSFADCIPYLPIMPPKNRFYERMPSEKTVKIYNELKRFVFSADAVLIATDPDYEGKALGKEPLIKTNTYDKVLADIRMENLSKKALQKELDNALKGVSGLDYDTMANIGLLRGDLNYGIGINLSRYLIGTMNKKVTFGTAQTRIIDLIVKRTIEYLQFNRRKYYVIKLKTDIGEFVTELDENIKFDKDKVLDIAQKIDEKYIKVTDIKKTEKEEKPLKWYDGSDLAEEAAKILKTTPFELLDEKTGLLEKMYLAGIMTYPRTESKNMMPEGQFKEQAEIAKYYASFYNAKPDLSLKKKGLWYPDEKAIELKINHTPYTVAEKGIDIKKLSSREKTVFDLAVKRLFSVFYPNPVTRIIEVFGEAEGINVKLKEVSDISLGYKEIYGDKERVSKLDNMELSNKVFKINETVIEENETKPKPLYTTSSIIKMMKTKNIGTEGTYKALFEKVSDKERPFVDIKSKKIYATKFAMEFMSLIPEEAVYIINEFEDEILKKLENKKITLEEAFNKRDEIILKVFNTVKEKINENAEKLTELAKDSNVVAKCPECGANIIASKAGYVCINRKVAKIDGKWVNKGSCNFYIPYSVDTEKISYKINTSVLKKLINGKTVKIEVFYKKAGKKIKTKTKLENGRIKFIFEG